MLLPYLTSASPVSVIESEIHARFQYSFTPQYRFTSADKLPVITTKSDTDIRQFTWGIQRNSKAFAPALWVAAEGLLKNAQTRVLIRKNRCVVMINCFYIKSGKSVILLYKPGENILLLAGIWHHIKTEDEKSVFGFALITRPSPPRLLNYTDRMPIIIPRKHMRRYLNLQGPLMDISGMLYQSSYPRLNGYHLSGNPGAKPVWSRNDLLPSGKRIFRDPDVSHNVLLPSRRHF